ncbi:MAG: hypothetical protein JWL63_2241 [Rhodocyclales bacterium]|nr:hypothetical protein [Rhodocyclales bacterium]
MRTTADAHLDPVIEAIQTYLARHPGAADSELGIAQWWLHEWLQKSGASVPAETVRQALGRLQQLGVVENVDVAGNGRLWRAVQVPGEAD